MMSNKFKKKYHIEH